MKKLSNDSPFSFLWPEIDDAGSAKATSRLGFFACLAMAAGTAGMTTYALWQGDSLAGLSGPLVGVAYVEAFLFAGLGWGVWRMSRVAAVVALLLFLLEQILGAVKTGSMVGFVMPIVLSLFFISGVRGTIAFHRIRNELEASSNDAA